MMKPRKDDFRPKSLTLHFRLAHSHSLAKLCGKSAQGRGENNEDATKGCLSCLQMSCHD